MTKGKGSEPLHQFLLLSSGELRRPARSIPDIRNYIEEQRETSATFRISEIDGIRSDQTSQEIMEFAGSWKLHDVYSSNGKRAFVNPNYKHVTMYSDLIVECHCGETIVPTRTEVESPFRNAEVHAEDCLPHHRLRCQAKATEKQYNMLRRLPIMGWRWKDVNRRFGNERDSTSRFKEKFDLEVTTLRNEYKRRAGNTYKHLVHNCNEKGSLIADIYDVYSPSTLNRWYREHGDEEIEEREFVRMSNGNYVWK